MKPHFTRSLALLPVLWGTLACNPNPPPRIPIPRAPQQPGKAVPAQPPPAPADDASARTPNPEYKPERFGEAAGRTDTSGQFGPRSFNSTGGATSAGEKR